jgi:aminoglycoside phosphotransferase family enzyme/predicted kinase
MSRSDFYPHRPDRVLQVQTHISRVFLAGPLVYKVKKPVDFGFLDFTTLPKRARVCRDEVRLNRRFAPGIYLGVERITRTAGGFRLGGRGRTVEYAVAMRHVPEAQLLLHRLADGRVTPAHLRSLARLLAAVHAASPSGPTVSAFGSLQALRRNHAEAFRQIAPFAGRTICPGDLELLRRHDQAFHARHAALLQRRVADRRIRDGHGDLHAEHVGWRDRTPFALDCIEFNDRFRYADVAADIAFLAMDLEFRGAWPLAWAFLDEYLRVSEDPLILPLLDYYRCYRAIVRGKVDSLAMDDPDEPVTTRHRMALLARRYFRLATDYAGRDLEPHLVIMTGLAGTGKSRLASLLAETLGFRWLRSDILRKDLGAAPPAIRRKAGRSDLYTPEMNQRTYRRLLEEAGGLLQRGESVILDACFPTRVLRRHAREIGRAHGARTVTLWTAAPERVVRARLDRRQRAGGDPSDADWRVHVDQRGKYHAPDAAEASRIDTGRPDEAIRDDVLRALYPLVPVHPAS